MDAARFLLGPRAFVALGLLVATGLLVSILIQNTTRPKMVQLQQEADTKRLESVLGGIPYDNNLLNEIITVRDPELLGINDDVSVHLAKQNGVVLAVVFPVVAKGGYKGNIELLIGISRDGRVLDVIVEEHRETQGLGDGVDQRVSDWIHQFRGSSLRNPAQRGWQVKHDGGTFDQITGATVSPRAVVKGVRNALLMFENEKQTLLQTNP